MTLPNPVPAGTDPTLDKALEVLGATAAGSVPRRGGLTPATGAPRRRSARLHFPRIGYGSRERKEVMCSDRQY